MTRWEGGFPDPHVHPQSLDTGSTPEAFVERELELGTGTLTATDHGSLAAVRKIYDLARARGLTPALGLEGYHRDDDCPILLAAGAVKDDKGTLKEHYKYGHFITHFLDQEAYATCSRLLSKADLTAEAHGAERKPIFSWANMEELGAKNVTLTSGCLVGVVARHLIDHDDGRTAVAYYERMRGLARPGNFYVEVFAHDCSKNYEEAVFLTLEGQEARSRYYLGKTLRVDGEEVKAEQLAKRKPKDGSWGVLQAIKHRRQWHDCEPRRINGVELVEGFLEQPCRPWQGGNPDVQASVNRFMLMMAARYGDPVLISGDSHFARKDEKIVQDCRLAQSGPWRMWDSLHRQTSQEAFDHFQRTLGTSEAEFEGWLENNRAWAGRLKDFRFVTPASLPTKFYPEDTLRYLGELIAQHGRLPNDQRYLTRLDQEVRLFHDNGTLDLLPYFSLAHESVDLYSKEGLLTGPGRGSAAGVLINYLLDVTHVDPIKHGLSLDRFLTQDRIASKKMPDVDLDYPNRERLLAWLKERFGDHAAQISTDMTLRIKNACKDVLRMTRGHVPPEAEELTKRFALPPMGVTDRKFVFGYKTEDGRQIPGSITYDVALQEYAARYPQEWEVAVKCLALNKGKGRHPSAWAIMNVPVSDRIPLTTVGGERCTSFTMEAVESMGGIKMDYLRVISVADIDQAIRMIRDRSPVPVPADGVDLPGRGHVPAHRLVPYAGGVFDVWDPPADKAVFEDVVQGRTETVFQFNTESVSGWMKHFRGTRPDGRAAVDSVTDLAYFTALDRPGPLDMFVPNPDVPGEHHNMLVEYARRVQGRRGSPGVLPVLELLFPETQGVMITQEQMQYAYQRLTGCTGAEAEGFRRLAAKKEKAKVEKEFRFFFPRASQQLGEEDARKAWDFFITFSEYSFNYSHAYCYALIGYVCAWLKHHYPSEWWCAVLRNADKDEIAEKFWPYCRHLVDLPDLSRVSSNFDLVGERIVAPMSLLHGIGEVAHAQLLAGAPYQDLTDLVQRVEAQRRATGKAVRKVKKNKRTGEEREVEVWQNGRSAINRRVIYTLLIVGAMDRLLPPEIQAGGVLDRLAYYERVFAEVTQAKRVAAVPAWYAEVGAMARYIMRKEILPAYREDMRPVVVELMRSDIYRSRDRYFWDTTELVDGPEIKRLEAIRPLPDGGIKIAGIAYVADARPFSYKDKKGGGGDKHALELTLDIDGEACRIVAWPPRKGGAVWPTNVKGTIVAFETVRWAEGKGYSLVRLEILQRPVKRSEKEEAEDGEHGGDSGGGGAGA